MILSVSRITSTVWPSDHPAVPGVQKFCLGQSVRERPYGLTGGHPLVWWHVHYLILLHFQTHLFN